MTSPTEYIGACGAAEATLVDQLAQATRELRLLEAGGRRTEELQAIVRSLRRTLKMMAHRGSGLDRSSGEHTLRCLSTKALELWHRGRKLPANVEMLRQAFGTAGIRLKPGQVLLLDRELARRAIEESLVILTLDEMRIREAKNILCVSLHQE